MFTKRFLPLCLLLKSSTQSMTGHLLGGAGDDADAVDYFGLDDLPELAFPTDEMLLGRLRAKLPAAPRQEGPASVGEEGRKTAGP